MAHGRAHARPDKARDAAPGREVDAWRDRIGESFTARTAMGRSVTLTLARVSAWAARAHTLHNPSELRQFNLTFEGARHLPLHEGLHTLLSASHGPLALHLQPHRQGDGIQYTAHFSLLT